VVIFFCGGIDTAEITWAEDKNETKFCKAIEVANITSGFSMIPDLTSYLPKIIKQRCFIREWGAREIFHLVWISIKLIFYIEILLYITAGIQARGLLAR
jgi:hypothetical protein